MSLALSGADGSRRTDVPTLNYNGVAVDISDLASYTFPAMPIGPADATRYVVIGVSTNSAASRSISGVSIGGVAATLLVSNGSTTTPSAIFGRAVAAGETADIVVTIGGGVVTRCTVTSWSLYNLITPGVGGDTIAVLTDSGLIDLFPAGIAVAQAFDSSSAGEPNWTGAMQDHNTIVQTSRASGAHYIHSGLGIVDHPIDANFSAGTQLRLVAIAFR
jgi:hypothetical protein